MRIVQPVALLLGAVMYFSIIAWALQINDEEINAGAVNLTWILVVVPIWNVLMLVATILAILDGVAKVREGKTRQLGTSAIVVKLVAIPYFLLNYVVGVFFFNFGGISLVFGIGLVVWFLLAIAGVVTYVTMLSTNVYVWAAIRQLRRERTIGVGLTALYMILSFLFVTDVAAGVLLFGHSRHRPRLTLVWLLIGSGIAIALVGVVEFFYPILGQVFPELGDLEFNHQLSWLLWAVPVIAGLVVILPTVIISIVRRSALRLEAQGAAAAQLARRAQRDHKSSD